MLVCGGSTLGIKRPKTPCPRKWERAPRPRDRNLDTSMRFLNDLWSIHGKMDIKFLFMDRNLDLCCCFFFKMYYSTRKARYPHSRADLSYLYFKTIKLLSWL